MPYNAADVEIFQIQALFTVASGIKKVLEGAKSAPDLSEVLGKYPGHRSSDGGKTTLKSVPRVRRLTEHVKVCQIALAQCNKLCKKCILHVSVFEYSTGLIGSKSIMFVFTSLFAVYFQQSSSGCCLNSGTCKIARCSECR